MIVDRWSYGSGLAPADLALVTSGGQVSVDLLKLHIISTANVYYTAGKIAEDGSIGYDVIARTESKPSAGEYFVTGDGFSARNYVFEVPLGKLKISKAPISIMTGLRRQCNQNLRRPAGTYLHRPQIRRLY